MFRRQPCGGAVWIAATLAARHDAANAIAEITLIASPAALSSSAALFGTRPAHPDAPHRPDLRAVLKGDGEGAIRDGVEGDMKQASSRELFGYWAARRGKRAAPERGEIEPGAIRRALADAFILEFDRHAGHPFRLAGTRICALLGRELKNEALLDLWDEETRAPLAQLVSVVAD